MSKLTLWCRSFKGFILFGVLTAVLFGAGICGFVVLLEREQVTSGLQLWYIAFGLWGAWQVFQRLWDATVEHEESRVRELRRWQDHQRETNRKLEQMLDNYFNEKPLMQEQNATLAAIDWDEKQEPCGNKGCGLCAWVATGSPAIKPHGVFDVEGREGPRYVMPARKGSRL